MAENIQPGLAGLSARPNTELLGSTSMVRISNPKRVREMRPTHHFYDNFGKIEAGTAFGLAAYDVGQTCHALSRGGHEELMRAQSCGGVAGTISVAVFGQEALAYVLHCTRHHRFERAARLFSISESIRGIAYSASHNAGTL